MSSKFIIVGVLIALAAVVALLTLMITKNSEVKERRLASFTGGSQEFRCTVPNGFREWHMRFSPADEEGVITVEAVNRSEAPLRINGASILQNQTFLVFKGHIKGLHQRLDFDRPVFSSEKPNTAIDLTLNVTTPIKLNKAILITAYTIGDSW